MDCNSLSLWIWEVLEAPSNLPDEVDEHLRVCRSCAGEYAARRSLDQDLKELRADEQEEPSEAINRRVLSALAARAEPGTTARPPALGIVTPSAVGAGESMARGGRGGIREAVRAISPLLALGLALSAVGVLGFSLGQSSIHSPPAGEVVASWARFPRTHQVVLSERAIEALEVGSTYMLVGPRGGPYQVIDVTTWERADSVGPTVAGRDELVLAVGPAGGWSRGKTVLLGDLAGSGTEILARRALKR
jgi:hypothetical protein